MLNNSRGFSLIEVMVSLVVGLISLLMVVNIYSSTRESHVRGDRVSEALENGRYAMRQIANDLQSAGYLGGVLYPSKIQINSSLAIASANDCGKSTDTNWAIDLTNYDYIQFHYQPTASALAIDHKCISTTDFLPNTDVVVIKRVFGDKSTGSLTLNNVYLRSDLTNACLWYYSANSLTPSGSTCPTSGFDDWRYLVNIYYIQKYSKVASDMIPTLCKMTLSTSGGISPQPAMQKVCLADGVELIHVDFGVDTDNISDGVANQFNSNPSVPDLKKSVTARIYVLARSLRTNDAYSANKTYTLGLSTPAYTPGNDKYYRRVFSTSVQIRNRTNLINL